MRPSDALLLESAASYTDARYEDSVYAAPGATSAPAGKGDYLPVAPWTVVGSGEYKIPPLFLDTTWRPRTLGVTAIYR